MATLTLTFTAGSDTGALLRRAATQLQRMSYDVPDKVSTGASTVVTIDNAPTGGNVSFQVTAGPYTSSNVYVV